MEPTLSPKDALKSLRYIWGTYSISLQRFSYFRFSRLPGWFLNPENHQANPPNEHIAMHNWYTRNVKIANNLTKVIARHWL